MVDKYDKVRVLGSGTYGRAWLVKLKKTSELFVMKEIKVQNKRELEEAKTEAELLSKFSHPNIIKYQEVIQTASKVVNIVMEYAAGGDLQGRLNRRKTANSPFSQEEILRWLAQLCEALLIVHQQGMMHRDIKLANLFLTQEGQLKLGDFGIARVLDHNAINVSARTCRTPIGTPMYMAPESCSGKPYGQKADMWAVGCALYELLTFSPAFNAQSLEGLMHRIKRGRYDHNFPAIYSRELQDLVHSLLNVNSEARPSIKQVMALPLLAPYVSKAPQGRVEIPSELAMRKKQSAPLERLAEERDSDQGSVCARDPSDVEEKAMCEAALKRAGAVPGGAGGAGGNGHGHGHGQGERKSKASVAGMGVGPSGGGDSGGSGESGQSELKPLKRVPHGMRPSMDPTSDSDMTPVRGGGAGMVDDRARRALFDDRSPLSHPQPKSEAQTPWVGMARPSAAGGAGGGMGQYDSVLPAVSKHGQRAVEAPWSYGDPVRPQPRHAALSPSDHHLQDPWHRFPPARDSLLPNISEPSRAGRADVLMAGHGGRPAVLVVEHDPLNNSLHVARRKAAKRETPSMMDLVDRYQQRHAGDMRRRPVAVGAGMGQRPY